MPRLEELDAQVLGVSCDSRFTLAAWKQAMGYRLRLLSDFWPHGEIGASYGVFDEEFGLHSRGTFIIDAGGNIRHVVATEMNRARDIASYVELVRAL